MPQPSTSGMVIPQTIDNSKYFENIDTNTSTIEAMLEMFFKFSQKDKERLSYQVEEMTAYQKELINFAKPNLPEEKKKKGLNKYFDKWFVKKDFLKTLSKFFKNMLARAGNWLTTLLEALLFFAIFDPKGTFLASILDFITRMVVKVIQVIMDNLPRILKTMWKLFWKIIVPGFGKMGKAIGETIFGEGSMGASILEWLGKFAPIGLVIAGVIGKIIDFWPALQAVFTGLDKIKDAFVFLKDLKIATIVAKFKSFISFISGGVMKIVVFFKTILMSVIKAISIALNFLLANPIILVIVAIIAAIALIWIYADEIAGFFERTLPRWYNSLSGWAKKIVDIILIITAPIWGLVYGLAKLFQSFKKIGVKQTMIILWEGLKKGAMALGKYLMSLPSKMWSGFKKGMGKMWDGLKSGTSKMWDNSKKGMNKIWSDLKNKLKQVGEYLLALPGKMWDSLKNKMEEWGSGISGLASSAKDATMKFFKDIIKDIADWISSISDWVTAFMTDPGAYLLPGMNREEKINRTKIVAQVLKETDKGVIGGATAKAAGLNAGDIAILKEKYKTQGLITKEDLYELMKSKEVTQSQVARVEKTAKVFIKSKRGE